jgi:hypothetical protein
MWMLMTAASAAFAGGSLSVASLSVDGLELRDLTCTLERQILLGPVTVAAALASQKPALDACGPEGQAFRVAFRWTGEAAVAVEAGTGAPAASACVQKVLAAVAPPVAGVCTIVVLTGPKEAAEAARTKLTPAPAK